MIIKTYAKYSTHIQTIKFCPEVQILHNYIIDTTMRMLYCINIVSLISTDYLSPSDVVMFDWFSSPFGPQLFDKIAVHLCVVPNFLFSFPIQFLPLRTLVAQYSPSSPRPPFRLFDRQDFPEAQKQSNSCPCPPLQQRHSQHFSECSDRANYNLPDFQTIEWLQRGSPHSITPKKFCLTGMISYAGGVEWGPL